VIIVDLEIWVQVGKACAEFLGIGKKFGLYASGIIGHVLVESLFLDFVVPDIVGALLFFEIFVQEFIRDASALRTDNIHNFISGVMHYNLRGITENEIF
jgi:hypothetical protein